MEQKDPEPPRPPKEHKRSESSTCVNKADIISALLIHVFHVRKFSPKVSVYQTCFIRNIILYNNITKTHG